MIIHIRKDLFVSYTGGLQMKFAVITGVSKGLGESAAKFLLETGVNVIGVSRSQNSQLAKIAAENNTKFTHYPCDLGDLEQIEETFAQICDELFTRDPEAVFLVNNAAVLEPIDQAMNIPSKDLAYHIRVNTMAPMVITNLFLQKAAEKDVLLLSVTVTSGAGERPVYGWSAYCSTKASINMYTKAVALEQEKLNTGNKVFAFSPGIMDTDMQEKIRASKPEEFVDVDKFRSYKEKNLLSSTEAVAGVLVDILTDESNVENGKIYNVRDYF